MDALEKAATEEGALSRARLDADVATTREIGPARRAFRRLTAVLVAADALAIVATLVAVHAIITKTEGFDRRFVVVLIFAPALWIGVLHAFHLYEGDQLAPWEEFRGLISATSIGVVLLLVGTFWWKTSVSRAWLGWAWLIALLLELAVRRVYRWYVRHGKRTGRLALRTLIVGTGDEAARMRVAMSEPVRGFRPVGHIAVTDKRERTEGLPVVGAMVDLAGAITQHDVECVFVSSSEVPPALMSEIARVCRRTDSQLRFSANLPETLMTRLSVQSVDDVPVLSLRPVRLTGMRAFVKRSVDALFGAVGLVVASPFLVLIGAAIRLTSKGPALFHQARVTKDGRIFTMYKFRTMVVNPEAALNGAVIDVTRPFFKLEDDPRVTRVGRFLRSWSLDELPQLWNVVKGDMSLVGPRALPVEQVATDQEALAHRNEVRAGMTGWWQIQGRSDVDYERALKMDLFYIENWSLTLDLYIILKSIGAVLARRGAV
jgi:exopolysaccharide biosynthesis polyprenyl glycosylphosphotransferase